MGCQRLRRFSVVLLCLAYKDRGNSWSNDIWFYVSASCAWLILLRKCEFQLKFLTLVSHISHMVPPVWTSTTIFFVLNKLSVSYSLSTLAFIFMKPEGGLNFHYQFYLAVKLGRNDYGLRNSVGGRQMEHGDAWKRLTKVSSLHHCA